MTTNIITLDFETYYSKDYGLKKLTTEAYIRDPQFEVIGFSYKVNDGPAKWVSGDKTELRQALLSLQIHNCYLLCHNTAFDGAILNWHFGIKPKYYLDTLSMARPITGLTVGGSLAALAKLYNIGQKGTEVIAALGKRRLDFNSDELEQYGEYCKNDTEITYQLYHLLKPHNPTREMYIQDLMLRMFIDPVLELDRNTLSDHLANVQAKKTILMDRIDTSIGRDSLLSNPKFAEILTKLGVSPPVKVSPRTLKETFAFSKTDHEFNALLEHKNPMVQAVVSARLGIKSTLEETRTESFLGISERGRLPILLNYWGAHTGRASGGDKMNLQNLPRGGALRKAIKAPEGHAIIACDSAQIEARVVAWLANQDDLISDFAENVDIYSKFATSVYNKMVTKADKVERFVGKTCILGLGYGMGAEKFKNTLKIGMGGIKLEIPIDEAKRIVYLYRSNYQSIVDLWGKLDKYLDVMATGREDSMGDLLHFSSEGVMLPNGTMLRYPNLHKSSDGYSYQGRYGPVKIYGGKFAENIVQALARIVVFDQMSKIDQEMRKRDSADQRFRVALTVHDEIVCIVPKSEEDWATNFMLSEMKKTPKWCSTLPLSCEAASGENYGDCK
jgi:DNA polymerase